MMNIPHHIEKQKQELIEKYETWVAIALVGMEDITKLSEESIRQFKTDLNQLISACLENRNT